MTSLSRTLALALGAWAALVPAARADDLSALAGMLDVPVVSTASKSAETAGLAPATTSVISADDLRRYAFTSLDEALDFLGVGMLTERSYGTAEIGARGVLLTGDYGNHVLLLVDGHAVNEPWDGTAYFDQSAGIPLDLVDHVEVILGPGSVLYGSSAMLGVVNIITKRAKDYPGVHVVADGGYPTMTHLAGGLGRMFTVGDRQGELTLGLDWHQTWGPDATYALQPYGDGTWGGKATHREVGVPSAYLRVSLGELQLAIRASQSQRTATNIWGDFDHPRNWERDGYLSADLRWSRDLGRGTDLAVRLYGDAYRYREQNPTLDCLAGQTACTGFNPGDSRWAGAEVSVTHDWLDDGRYVTLLGVDARYRDVTSSSAYQDSTTGVTTTVDPYASRNGTVGAYLQQTLRPLPWLNVNAGLRLDSDPGLGSHLSPRLALVVPAWSGGTVKAIYSEAFRAPTVFERDYSDGTTQLAAGDLRPEIVRSVEGVVEQRLGATHLRVSAFRSWWTDMVLLSAATPEQIAAAIDAGQLPPGTTDATVYANASRIDSFGADAELGGSAMAQRLRWGLSLTLARSRRNGARLEAAASAFGNAHVSWDLGGPGSRAPTLALAALAVGPRLLSGSGLDPVPDASGSLSLRGAVTGPLSAGVSYRLAATWSSTDTTAYAVGPARDQPGDVLPSPRWQVLAGLRLDR